MQIELYVVWLPGNDNTLSFNPTSALKKIVFCNCLKAIIERILKEH